MAKICVADIETKPKDVEYLRTICPPFQKWAPFDVGSVRTGNIKDQDKIAAKVNDARCKYEHDHAEAEREHFEDFASSATLKAQASTICAVGYKMGDAQHVSVALREADEKDLLEEFWDTFKDIRKSGGRIIGHNFKGFDLPIIRRRSFVLGVKMPGGVIDKNRYWSSAFEDTMEVWSCGTYPPDKISLDTASKMLGGPGKLGKGEHFHLLLASGKVDKAIEYVMRDLEETWRFADALGLLEAQDLR